VLVISNASPLIALTQIGRLDLLRQLHTRICDSNTARLGHGPGTDASATARFYERFHNADFRIMPRD